MLSSPIKKEGVSFLKISFFFFFCNKMPPAQPPQRNEILDWYNSIPPITKALFTLSIATTTCTTFGLIEPTTLILYWPNIRYKLQVSI